MFSDQDMKIAGDKPSRDIKRNREVKEQEGPSADEVKAAKELGAAVAAAFLSDDEQARLLPEDDDSQPIIQRRLLLSFTATVGFEQYCKSDTLAGLAQKSFLDALKKANPDLYKTSSDTGAFSFYYLAYRRGSEIERRIGQTFAMLCGHDGDPIYQELGEALYCWFLSVVRKQVQALCLSD